jgi:hypothetical protein
MAGSTGHGGGLGGAGCAFGLRGCGKRRLPGWQVQRLQGPVRAAVEACSVTACCGVWLVEMVVGGRGMAPSGGRALHPPVQRGDEEDGFLQQVGAGMDDV